VLLVTELLFITSKMHVRHARVQKVSKKCSSNIDIPLCCQNRELFGATIYDAI
jgi:hypothetical protein